MSIISRFFGRKEPAADQPNAEPAALVSNPDQKDGMSLQVAFAGPLPNRPMRSRAPCRPITRPWPTRAPNSIQAATIGWAWRAGASMWSAWSASTPPPEATVEVCVRRRTTPPRSRPRCAHASHVLLYYTGHDADPLEQYVAVAAVAGALAEAGGVAVMNEHAHTSLPAGVFTRALGDEPGAAALAAADHAVLRLREVRGGRHRRRVDADPWRRPLRPADFAALAEGHHQGEFYSNIFNNIMAYLLQSGAEMDAGHTMQIGENAYLKLREPDEPEYFLQGRAARWSRRSSPRTRSTGRTPGRDRARPAAPAGRARVLSPPDDFRMDTDGTDPARQAAQGAGTRGPGCQAHAPRAPGPQARERHASDRHDRPSPLHANLPRLAAYLDRVPGVRVLSSEVTPDAYWWVKLTIDIADPLAWRVVQNWASC